MANAEQLKRLRQGVEEWNQWRFNNPEVQLDLSEAILNAVSLSGANLSGANLSGANLSGADLIGANLSTVSLIEALLIEVYLGGADLRGANLRNANLRDANLIGANLITVDLSGANLRNADLRGANLRDADLSGANLIGVNLRNAKLSGATLSGATLIGATLIRVDLSEAHLIGADLSVTDLSNATLSNANLRGTHLSGTHLSGTHLSNADLRGANLRNADLSKADLSGTHLIGADLSNADLRGAYLNGAHLHGLDLSGLDLRGSDLRGAYLNGAAFRGADLRGADLRGADLRGLDLSGADLRNANLCNANLSRVQVLRTNFEQSVLTGACLEDWNINSATRFGGVICDYLYLKADQQERRPRDGLFKSGEFAALFQQAVDTIELIFKDGIDWQAFFQSFKDLRSQYADQELSIQAIEKKHSGAFIVRVEVAEGADKSAIESRAKELYETKLTLMEQQYRTELQAKDREIAAYKHSSASMEEIAKLLASRPIKVENTAVADQSSNTDQIFNAPVANAAGTNYGTMSAIQNNYGSNTEDITRLLTALRDQAQTFPTDQKDDANDALDLLERDLKEEQPDQNRISRRLKKLVALGAAIGTIASGAAAVSGDVSTFTGNVIELTEQLGIPVEQVQLPPSGTP